MKKKHLIINIIFAAIILGLCLININKLNFIFVLNDEFGYWGNAAAMLGYDWQELMAETIFYSPGYSILLIPILAFFPSAIWYQSAVILNSLLIVATYFISCRVAKYLFKKMNDTIISIACFLVAIFPSNIFYAQIAWCETLLYFLVWLLTYLLVRLERKYSFKLFISILILFLYTYFVHARNVGIIFVGGICLILILWKHKKLTTKTIIASSLVVFIGYIIIQRFKNYQITSIWSNSPLAEVNNVSLDTNTIKDYFTQLFSHLRLYAESLGGKFLYLLMSSGGLVLVGSLRVVGETINNIKEKKLLKNQFIIKFWAVSIILIMWGLSALQMMSWQGRKDTIVYSRYMEYAIGPILLLGIMCIITNCRKKYISEIITIILILVGLRSVYYRVNEASGIFNSVCSPYIAAFYDNVEDLKEAFILMGSIGILLAVLLIVCSHIKKEFCRTWVTFFIFGVFFCIAGYKSTTGVIESRVYLNENIDPAQRILDDYKSNKIYYIKDVQHDLYSNNPKYLQFLLPKQAIHVIEDIDLINYQENDIFILNPNDEKNSQFFQSDSKMEQLLQNQMYNIYAVTQD